MAKMQNLQPKMKAIKKKYKNTKDMEQRKLMNMEMMALYKQEKVNPAGGCLPILLQLPILLRGFSACCRVSINVRHEPWMLWITDLSKKDPYYVLPILMGVTQLIQQRMTPSGGDDMQKKLMYILPVVMVVMFASFPSGLNLYWCMSNVLQIGQQYIVNEKIHKQKKEEEHEIKIIEEEKRSQREMTEKKEFVANSLKDAIQKAAEDLGIQEEKLKYRIITEKTKYFGHKQREIFIEAWRSDGSEQQGLEDFVRLLLAEMKLDLRFELESKSEFLRVNFVRRGLQADALPERQSAQRRPVPDQPPFCRRDRQEDLLRVRELPQEKGDGAQRPGPPPRAPGAAQRQGRRAARAEPL